MVVYRFVGDKVDITVTFKNTGTVARTFTVVGELFQNYTTSTAESGASLLPGGTETVVVSPTITNDFAGNAWCDVNAYLYDYDTGEELSREENIMAVYIDTLPSDEDNMTYPGSRTISFGYFDPPVPFSATDQEKMDAPVTTSRWVNFNNFPEFYEMVRAYIYLTNIHATSDISIRFRWYNVDTGDLLFTYNGIIPAGDWDYYWYKAWIGHCPSEINQTGLYKCIVDFPSPGAGLSGSYTWYFAVTGTNPTVPPGKGWIDLWTEYPTGTPYNAYVYLDGNGIGWTGNDGHMLIETYPGTHRIVTTSNDPAYGDNERYVDVVDGETTYLLIAVGG